MSRQDKATTEKNAKSLRELLKRPENKLCADCKRNDPRWASWNLGVFLCIRCSGIHRSMGTHISRVKSVDLDVWTPEQLASVQKWGNRLANLYWEAHLRAGHIPQDHKMDSFIRSKYESRRWALDGPPPADPSVLDSGTAQASAEVAPISALPPPASSAAAPATPRTSISITNRQPQPRHQLLSSAVASRPRATHPQEAPSQPTQPPQPAPAAVQSPANDLFTLDFHAPAATSPATAPKKDIKQDILSLFSAPAAPAPVPGVFGQFGTQQAQAGWDGAAAQQQAQPNVSATAGAAMWGWNPSQTQAPANPWGTPTVLQHQQQPSLFGTSDVWATNGTSTTVGGVGTGSVDLFGSSSLTSSQKKDDAFGDIWGEFK